MEWVKSIFSSAIAQLFSGAAIFAGLRAVWRFANFVQGLKVGNPIIRMIRYIPSRRVLRISMSTLLYLEDEGGNLLLYHEDNQKRTPTTASPRDSYWAPVGGVLKTTDSEKWQQLFRRFDIHTIDGSEASSVEGKNDIRLYLPARRSLLFLSQLLALVRKQRAIETPVGAMHRELIEEIVGDSKDPSATLLLMQKTHDNYLELGGSLLRLKSQVPVTLFKLDSKRPRQLMHLRLFYVVEPVDGILLEMVKAATEHEPERFFWATKNQIELGHRHIERGTRISDHAKAILETGLSDDDKLNLEGVMPGYFEKEFDKSR